GSDDGNGTSFVGFFNFINIGAVNNNLALAHQYFKIEDSADDAFDFLSGKTYQPFVTYMRDWAVSTGNRSFEFDANHAAQLVIGGGFAVTDNGQPNQQAVDNITKIYKQL